MGHHKNQVPDEELFITQEYINELEKEMLEAAEHLEFERAAILRGALRTAKTVG